MTEGAGEKTETIVIIGASYAGGWTPPALAGFPVVTKGVDGEESHELLSRFDRDVVAPAPKAVIIWGFINDFHRTPMGEWEQTRQVIRESFTAMVEKARAAGIEPIVTTEVTLRGRSSLKERAVGTVARLMGKKSYQDRINESVMGMNRWLRQYADRKGLLLIDIQPLLSDSSGRRAAPYAREDGSHLTGEAYEALTAFAGSALEGHFQGTLP